MSKYWSNVVNALTPYVPGEQPNDLTVIKLNTNENPYGPSPAAIAAINAVADDNLRRYPDPNSDNLKAVLAARHGLNTAQVFVGNGSDEVLAHIFQGLLKHPDPVLFPDVTYSFYPVYCALYNIDYQCVALNESLEIDLSAYAQPNGGIIFANPNAPTGRALPPTAIAALVSENPDSVVVIDEAYVSFGGESCAHLIQDFDNLLIVQTLSKSHALAGLRVGFAYGHEDLITGLERIKNSFNSYPLDKLAVAGAIAALQDDDYYDKTCAMVIATRERATAAMEELGFSVFPSQANFVFAKHQKMAAFDIAQSLREYSIIVRHFAHERTKDYLRITIGTDDEIDQLIAALKAILA